MKEVFKFLTLIFPIFFTVTCTNPLPENPPPERDAGLEEESHSEDDAPLRNARREHGDSGPCSENRDCEEICDDIYEHRPDKNRCVKELPVRQVELLEEVYDTLNRDINREDLDKITPNDLQILMYISVDPVITLASRMNAAEAKEVLTWLAESKEPVEIFKVEDKKLKILKALLAGLNENKTLALNTPISKGDRFIEIALDKGNYTAVDWVHAFFDEDCGPVNNYTECVFKDHYCNLTLNTRAESSYFEYDPFSELLEKVLEDARPSSPPLWWNDGVDMDDLDTWLDDPHNVCAAAEFK